jgi:hypothetical protein
VVEEKIMVRPAALRGLPDGVKLGDLVVVERLGSCVEKGPEEDGRRE